MDEETVSCPALHAHVEVYAFCLAERKPRTPINGAISAYSALHATGHVPRGRYRMGRGDRQP